MKEARYLNSKPIDQLTSKSSNQQINQSVSLPADRSINQAIVYIHSKTSTHQISSTTPCKIKTAAPWLARIVSFILSFYLPVSSGCSNQSINQLSSQPVDLSNDPLTSRQSGNHFANKSVSQSVSPLVNRSVSHLDSKTVSWSMNLPVNQSVSKSVSQSISQSISRSVKLSVKQSVTKAVSLSIRQSTIQVINQQINLLVS